MRYIYTAASFSYVWHSVINRNMPYSCFIFDGLNYRCFVFPEGYACNDRLGVNIDNFAYQLVPVLGLDEVHIVKVAVHSCGQHCLALDTDGNVYSWGTQTHGRLGHGGVVYTKGPRCIETLKPNSHTFSSADSKPLRVSDVFAGYAHSAIITDSVG